MKKNIAVLIFIIISSFVLYTCDNNIIKLKKPFIKENFNKIILLSVVKEPLLYEYKKIIILKDESNNSFFLKSFVFNKSKNKKTLKINNKKDAIFVEIEEIPPGFENIKNEKANGEKYFSIYYEGYFLGIFKIIYNQKELYFENNKDLRNKIIKNFNIKNINKHNFKKFKKNNTCDYCYQNNSGINIEILFEEEKIILSFNSENLETESINFENNPPATADFSAINSIRAYSNINFNGNNNFNINNNSVFSFKKNRVKSNWGISEDEGYMESLYFEKDLKNNKVKLGYYDYDIYGNAFLNQNKIYGFQIKTQEKNFNNIYSDNVEPIYLTLSNRATVNILKDGQLYFSETLGAGFKEIYAPGLPNGSYFIEIRTSDVYGNEKVERQFYVKSNLLTSSNKNSYVLDFGYLSESDLYNEEFKNKGFFRFGKQNRIFKRFGLYQEIFNVDGLYYSPSLLMFNNKSNFKLGFIYNLDKKENGYFTSSNISFNENQNLNIYYKKSLKERGFERDILNINYYLSLKKHGSFSAGYSKNNSFYNNINKSSNNYYMKYLRSLRHNNSISSFSLTFNGNEDENYIDLSYNLYFNFSNYKNRLRTAYIGKNDFNYETELNINNTKYKDDKYKSNNINLYQNNNGNTIELSRNEDLKIGNYKLSGIRKEYKNSSGEYITANYSGGLAYVDGKFSAGKIGDYRSGVVINLSKVSNKKKFNIIINEKRRGRISSGESKFISLEPYKKYMIEIEPYEESFVGVENKKVEAVLYDSNIQNIKFNVFETNLIITKIFKDGKLVKNKDIKSDVGTYYTDDNGLVQFENIKNKNSIMVEGLECNFNLPQRRNKNIIYLNKIEC